MTKPTTDAGRRYSEQPPGSLDEWNVAILAIENEARANVTSHVTFPTPPSLDVDELAQIIRQEDGNHSLGAGALAERIVLRLTSKEERTVSRRRTERVTGSPLPTGTGIFFTERCSRIVCIHDDCKRHSQHGELYCGEHGGPPEYASDQEPKR